MEYVKMPRLGVTMKEGEITYWLKQEGEKVKEGEVLFEIESEKSTIEVEAQSTGVLKKIIVEEGQVVPVGEIVAIIADEDEEIDLMEIPDFNESEKKNKDNNSLEDSNIENDEEKTNNDENFKAVPRARQLAVEKDVSLKNIKGSGPGGIILEKDVRNAFAKKTEDKKETAKLSATSKAMAENISKSWQEIPQFTQIITVKADKLLQAKENMQVSLNALLIKAMADALKKHKIINSTYTGKKIKYIQAINIGIAVARDQELYVPVIKNAQNKSTEEIDDKIKKYAQKKEFEPADLKGGTITFSNLGKYGVETGTPIINYPQSCLVFAGKLEKKVMVDKEDRIEIVPSFKISIAFDHRIISGLTGAKFTGDLKEKIENIQV
ncbi:MAG: dihydrolipoamide acetyltransferase family protein [Halanaerobiales bacterium]